MLRLIWQKEDAYSSFSIKYGARNISWKNGGPVQASMPPPPVTMAASKLRIQNHQQVVKLKDKIIDALQAEKRSYLSAAAEEAAKRAHTKVNTLWRKHRALPSTPWLCRSEGTTKMKTVTSTSRK